MNEAAIIGTTASAEPLPSAAIQGGTIRRQLLGASLFPLAFFGLLAILVTASTLYEMTTKLVLERNTAQASAYALELGKAGSPQVVDGSARAAGVEQALVIDSLGRIISTSGATLVDAAFVKQLRQNFMEIPVPRSVSTISPDTQDQILVSYASIPGTQDMLILVQSWSLLQTPAMNYQLLLIALLVCGSLLSLVMLSASIGRILQPITDLAATASQAVPGSIFHPVPERGPIELRSLTSAFNQMVIQLAEQQATLRQYAQKALLSQEEERQRLSHELHDGTVQDLIGLAQRLELCRSEMESDPSRAKERLDELRGLAQHTLNEVRQISNALRPSILQDLGLEAALRVLCHDLQDEMHGTRCFYTVNGQQPQRLQPEMELAVFRVAQEALTNIRKHAKQVTEVCVQLDFRQSVVHLVVTDNGSGTAGPDVSQLIRTGHLGFAGMYERARLFGGKLEVKSIPGSGTLISMELPR